jgi:ABC-type transport system involved in cytochrome c biogenesis permease subunit
MKNIHTLGVWLAVAAAAFFALAPIFPQAPEDGFHLRAFGRLPVLLNGRLKPLDTVARNSLLIIHGQQTLESGTETLSAIAWLTELMLNPQQADNRKVFIIRNPETLAALGWNGDAGKYFSFEQLFPHLESVENQAALANKVDAQVRSPFQRDIIKLYERLVLYYQLKNTLQPDGTTDFKTEIDELVRDIHPNPVPINSGISSDALQRYAFLDQTGYFFPIPPEAPEAGMDSWSKMGTSLLSFVTTGKMPLAVKSYAAMASAYAAGDTVSFNAAVSDYGTWLSAHFPGTVREANLESLFNSLEPFYHSMVIYVIVFILACFSWLAWPQTLGRYAFALLLLAFVLHSAGLICRMVLEGRPPVTNLYSSAVFIGWGACLLGLGLERLFRNGIGSATASMIGFITLLIAHHLSMDGDTMEMMRAVLDTNVWLATHVVCVTLGYASTFLAGFLALTYIARGLVTPSLDAETARALSRMVYGVVCFATLFSFVGTILGGIWADQSWGRFWGWDPKENGAMLIVLWNAVILHAHWGGIVRQRGLMVMAVFGNIVTSWSWFGVNMLGIGLHSYGFMDSAFPVLIGFCISQVVFMALGCVPPRFWRSKVESRSSPPGANAPAAA